MKITKKLVYTILTLSFLGILSSLALAQDIVVPLPEDINNDGIVDVRDLVLVANAIGQTVDSSAEQNPDATGDGVVNVLDLVRVASSIGKKQMEEPLRVDLEPVEFKHFEGQEFDGGPNINCATISPDGRLVVAGGYKRIWIWDVETCNLLHTLTGHTNHLWDLDFSPDGTMLASACDDFTVRLWNVSVQAASHYKTLEGHTDQVRGVAFNQDATTIASASLDGTIRIWNVETGESIPISGHTGGVHSVDFSFDNKLVSSGEDGTLRLWTKSGIPILTMLGHTDAVVSVVWSHRGHKIASASNDHTVRIWDGQTGELLHTLEKHTGEVFSVVWSNDDQLLASAGGLAYGASSDTSVHLWDANNGQHITELVELNADVEGLDFTPDGEMTLHGTDRGTLILWDLNRSVNE